MNYHGKRNDVFYNLKYMKENRMNNKTEVFMFLVVWIIYLKTYMCIQKFYPHRQNFTVNWPLSGI